MALSHIRIRGAKEHNLQAVNLDIPRDRLVVITGLSGSGKSSLAFDTIYAEGQRKYMESMSAYARQFLDQLRKPDIESIEGLPPTIAIEQRGSSHNPRSTVATTTEIYDYLRLLFARIGTPRCWHRSDGDRRCGHVITSQSATQIVDHVMAMPEGTKLLVLAPIVRGKKGHHREVFDGLVRQGFVRARVDGQVMDLREVTASGAGTPFTTRTQRYQQHTIEAVVDRVVVRHGGSTTDGDPDPVRVRVADSVELSLKVAGGRVVLAEPDGDGSTDQLFSEHHACPVHPACSLEDLEPRLFSFNSPFGACPQCHGLGVVFEFDPDLVVPDPARTLSGGAIEPWRYGGRRMKIYHNRLVRRFCSDFGADPDLPFAKLGKAVRRILMGGTTDRDVKKFGTSFEGVLPNLHRRLHSAEDTSQPHWLSQYLGESPCETCHGARLHEAALNVFLTDGRDGAERNIHQVVAMTIEQAVAFFDELELAGEHGQIAEPILKEIRARLGFMLSVGLGYLNLNRSTGTLSGGEAQRIRLATQVGSGLVGCCYVLDEPTIGLHQRDNDRLIRTLRHLADIGNTVLVVEHDEDTIRAADYIVDIGPGPGRHGGQVVAAGSLEQVMAHPGSLTGRYLAGQEQIDVPERRRDLEHGQALVVKGARQNNLRGIDVTFPLGGLVCVTGVSGSGKSTLVNQILLRAARRQLLGSRVKPGAHTRLNGVHHVDRIIEVDQSPIGRTPRSNPATYTGLFDAVRALFARTREAKVRGYKPGRFSFNVKGGRCEACGGQGVKKIEMHFLPDVFVACDVCKGRRYNRETLQITYRGRNIADVLNMTIEEAIDFFESFPDVSRMLRALGDVGLSYIQLGQASTTLSGGEAQRVKLATELGKRSTGHTLYVLDEPTTGLHFADVKKLAGVLDQLIDAGNAGVGSGGNTVVVIEHNLDIIKRADWIIDLGPEGGDRGGSVVAAGTPEDLAAMPDSYTGQFLARQLRSLQPA